MKSDDFWLVNLGAGMGPLVLGTEYSPLLDALRQYGFDVDRLRLDQSGKISLPEASTQLVFSQASPRTLIRIDVSDEQLRFGSLVVIGKRAHEIVGIFKLSRKATLWSSLESEGQSPASVVIGNTTEQSRQLLAKGTIWIPRLGLGLTLRDGLVATVHLCDPAHSPSSGSGPWTKEQQMLSEVREIPPASLGPVQRNRSSSWIVVAPIIVLTLIALLIWWILR